MDGTFEIVPFSPTNGQWFDIDYLPEFRDESNELRRLPPRFIFLIRIPAMHITSCTRHNNRVNSSCNLDSCGSTWVLCGFVVQNWQLQEELSDETNKNRKLSWLNRRIEATGVSERELIKPCNTKVSHLRWSRGKDYRLSVQTLFAHC